MENIKRKKSQAYILLESLISMSLLALITISILSQINLHRLEIKKMNEKIEVLNTTKMALESNQLNLQANGVNVKLQRTSKGLRIFNGKGEQVLNIEMLSKKK